MAKATIHVDVVSAEESIYSGEAEFVVLPGEAGELGIYPRHTPLITRIKPGAVRITPAGGGAEQLIFVAGGILEVQPKLITVLADTAVLIQAGTSGSGGNTIDQYWVVQLSSGHVLWTRDMRGAGVARVSAMRPHRIRPCRPDQG